MARHVCPSCGASYNGKRCKNCRYETFGEEISHGLHTHAGEPLVVREPERKPIPRKDSFSCETRTKKRASAPVVLILMIVLVILTVVIVSTYLAVSVVSVSSPEAEVIPVACDTILYSAENIQIATNWEDGQEYTDGFFICLRNDTANDLRMYASQVIVNGYLVENANFHCDARRGRTGQGEFSLDEEELAYAGIETVQTLSIRLLAYDADSYDTVMESGPIHLNIKAIPNFVQPETDQGETLYEDEALRVVFREYRPNHYEPENLSRGKLMFYLENKSGRDMEISSRDAEVNGNEANLSLWCELPAQTRSVCRLHLFSLEDMGLQRLEQISEMSIAICYRNPEETDTWVFTDPLTIPIAQ